jgi:hypothetical protein
MADPHAPGHEPTADPHSHDHDDHGHGHGTPAAFPTIPEDSGADTILNAVAWLGLVVLLVFSGIMFTYAGRAAETGEHHQSAAQEAR